MRKRFFLLCCLTSIALGGAEMRPLTPTEKQFLAYGPGKEFSLGKTGWKIFAGEEKKAISPGFDDSLWRSGMADCALSAQGFRKRKMHTIRKSFDLPAGMEKKDLLLDLGFISFYDDVYLNGRRVGGYGTYPKAIEGSSWVRRKYFIPAVEKLLKPGKNQLTLFVYPGSSSGMYCGIPALREVDNVFFQGFKLKTPGREALAFNLSDAEHLNNFRPGVPLNLEMNLSCIHGAEQRGILRVEILDAAGKVLQKAETAGTVKAGYKTFFSPLKLAAPEGIGKYRFRMSFAGEDGKPLWKKECGIAVTEPVRFRLPVDGTLKNAPQRYNVSRDSVGHFGPRHHKDGKLVYDFTLADTRGGLAFSVRPAPDAPLLLMPNVAPSPKNQPPPKAFLTAKGYQYDGFPDAWIFGSIRPAESGVLKGITAAADWGKIEWNYAFEKGSMKFTLSTVHPAFRAATDAPKLRLFDGADLYGTGLPVHAAGIVEGKLLTGRADNTFPAEKLSENWMLVWFSGNEAYDRFDIPWLLVFKHRIKSLARRNALEFDFGPRGAGEVLGMPLFGVTLQRPAVTEKWADQLPEKVLTACRRWSRILAASPMTPERTFSADFASDTLTIHDEFLHRPLNDDWNTAVSKTAPVYPLLPLILSSGSITGAIHAEAEDLEYATSHGPLFAVPGSGVTVRFKDLLHFVSEVRVVKQAPLTDETKAMISRLNNHMMKFLHGPMKKHPGNWLFWRNKFVPGNAEGKCELSDVIDAWRYTASNITAKQKTELRKEVEEYFLFEDILPQEAGKSLLPRLRDHAVTATVVSPAGRKLATFHPNEDDFAIDSCCWESLKIYALWDYARTCDGYDFIRRNREKIENCYNLIPNSHDWPIGISYDTYSGIRVGNGLQETGIMHAGMAAMARLAHQLGDTELRDRASYYSVMQLCGLLGAMSANAYLRDHRPTVAGGNRDFETQFCEYYRKIHYVEFNENGGLTQYVMLARTNLNSLGSYIMTPLPEVMRPYREIFTVQTDDFFDLKYDHIPFNRSLIPFSPRARQYMVRKYPYSAMDLYRRRKDFAKDVTESISDICAALDSLGEVRYRKLWTK